MPEFKATRKTSMFTIVVSVFTGLILVLAAYFLFFAAEAPIEIILPKNLVSVTEISKIQFDPTAVVGSAAFKELKAYTPAKIMGPSGRPNPFVPF